MTLSIRNFLLINLLLALIFITSISAFGDYYLSQADIRRHMDALLEEVALSFAAVTTSNLAMQNLNAIQTDLISVNPETGHFFYAVQENNKNTFLAQGKYYFQLWNDQGNLLLYSAHAEHLALNSAQPGLSDVTLNGNTWRVFKIHDPQKHVSFIVGERYNIRDELVHRIAQNNFYIMLLTYPISGLLIWLIIGWGLKSLNRVTNEVSNRAPTYLEPVDLHAVPIEIKPLIDELNKLFLRLREAFEREKRFAADAAHELRTPLAALKTQAQVALKTKDENERQTLLENLIHAVDRIVHIVQQLLTLSRLVPEAISVYDMTDINLSRLSAETIAQLAPMAVLKNIDIELDAPPTNIMLKGNLTGISILIRNLVDNAIRYTPEHGNVKVVLTEDTTTVSLKVIDSGPGIPAELRSRVFERFYRIIGTNVSGSGLGLAIVQQIAQLHQATINLSTPSSGIGLQFEVRFPKSNKTQSVST